MVGICLFFALIVTFLYVNIIISEVHSSPFHNTGDEYNNLVKRRSLIKYILILCMSLLWAIVIRKF